jgi:hypothetical protein
VEREREKRERENELAFFWVFSRKKRAAGRRFKEKERKVSPFPSFPFFSGPAFSSSSHFDVSLQTASFYYYY